MNFYEYKKLQVYKSALGWKEKKPDDKHEPTHYILSKNELREIENYAAGLESEVFNLKRAADKKDEEARQALQVEKKSSFERLEQLNQKIEELEEQLSAANALNVNLKRICTERANQNRNLRPKKQHPGFILLSTSSYFERFKDNKDTVEFTAYKSVIQTPYDVSMDFDVVRSLVNEGEVFSCAMAYFGSNLNEKAYNEYQERNLVFRWQLRATTSKKFWEIEAYHTCPFNGENLFII